jgi:superfamily I DNA/RNA helicase
MPYYFNLPLVTDLTVDQQRAVDIPGPLALSGGPGTGKSVVCLWRHISNHSTGQKNSLLLTYTKTLEHYLKASASTQNDEAAENINRVFWWLTHEATEYDEIIIDEGQDIIKSKFQRFFNYAESVSYGADERQSMYLSDNDLEELTSWLGSDERFSQNEAITLNRNFRNSREILIFTRAVFPDFAIPQNTINQARATGLKPIMKVNQGWVAILVPFASQVRSYYDLITEELGDDVEITKYENEQEEFEGLGGVHVTTFKSSKGTEFDTVIIPDFDSYSWNLANRPNVVTENDYYVAFTRAKTNLFLICRNGFPNIGDINTVIIE